MELIQLPYPASRKVQRWLVAIILVVVLSVLRLPWREADGGNYAFWSYAFFVTDEQMYTDGGRLAVLTSRFLDPELSMPPTFLGSWGMHLLSYLGYRFDGLTLGAARWPTMILAIAGWLAAYAILSRRTSAGLAGVVVLLASCNPLSLTYERTASTDVVVGALGMMAYALVTRRTGWKIFLGGLLMGFSLTVKSTAFPFLILFTLAIVSRRRPFWPELSAAFGALLVCVALLWAVRQACIHAVTGNADPGPVLLEITRGNSTLDKLDYNPSHWLKSYSIFPRWPHAPQLGLLAIGLFALPAWIICLHWHHTGRLFDRSTVAAWGIILYLLPLGTQAINPIRYFIPAVFLLPELLIISRTAGRHLQEQYSKRYLLLGGAFVALSILYWFHGTQAPREELLQTHLYNDFTLPGLAAWSALGIRWGIGVASTTLAVGLVLLRKTTRHVWPAALALGFTFAWMFFNGYTVSLLTNAREFVRNQVLLQAGLILTLASLLCLRDRHWQHWYLIGAAGFLVFASLNTYWKTGYRDLWSRQFHVRDASHALASAIPSNSIVIGRRAPLLLRNTPIRAGLGSFAYSSTEFMERVGSLLDHHPEQPLYWLIDGDGCPTWDYYQQETNHAWIAKPVMTLSVPSGDTLVMPSTDEDVLPFVPIYLLRIKWP